MSLSVVLFAAAARAQDLENGKDINGTCAACHGATGRGGKMGEYPRLAGQRPGYLAAQLKAFRLRKRINIPMFPYTQERELNDADIVDISAYLSRIALPSVPPQLPSTATALERLAAADAVLVVPHVDGDADAGAKLFRRKCASCHGRLGQGKRDFPRLVGQYPDYLLRQLKSLKSGARRHEEDDPMDGALATLEDTDLKNILAWLTSIQSEPLTPEPVEERDGGVDAGR